MNSEVLVDPGTGLPDVLVQSQSTVEAANFLMGFQGGFEFNKPITPTFSGQAFIKVGGYFNPTEVTTEDVSTINPAVIATRQTKSTGAFVGEVGGKLYMDLVPQCAFDLCRLRSNLD